MRKIILLIFLIFLIAGVSVFGYSTLKKNRQPATVQSQPISAPAGTSSSASTFSTIFEFRSDISNVSISDVNNQAITDSLLALNVLPLQNQPFVGDEPFITFHTISPTKIRIVIKDLKNLDSDEKKDADFVKRILLNVPNEASYFVGVLQDSNNTLEIPVYIDVANVQKSNFGIDKNLSLISFKSLYLNLQTPPLQGKVQDILTTFDEKISTVQSSAFKINIRNGVSVGTFKLVPDANAQNCSGVATCGNLVENPGRCAGGPNVGASCTNQSMCPQSSCQGITFTCGGPQYAQNCSFVGGTGPVSCTGGGACPSCALSQSCIYTPPVSSCTPNGTCLTAGSNCCNGSYADVSCSSGARCGTPIVGGGGGGGGGNTCSGDCFSGLSNCGQVGRQPVAGSCTGGAMCCGFVSGGGAACNVEFQSDQIQSVYTVGVPATVRVFVRGGFTSYDGIWGFQTCTSSPCSTYTVDPVLGSFNPSLHPTTPYDSTFVPSVAGSGFIHFRAEGDNGGPVMCQGKYFITILPKPATCSVDLLPNSISVSTGSSQAIVPNITFTSGTVTSVTYSTANNAASATPVNTAIPPYNGQVNGLSVGTTSVTARVNMSDGSTCTDTSPVTVNAPVSNAWWQVTGGNVVTNQNLQSLVPTGQTFMLNGAGGFPGNATYGASTTLTKTNVSALGWLGNLTYNGKMYNSTYFNSLASSTVTFNNLPSIVSQADFDTGIASSDGYYWYKASGNLTINSKININGNRKVVLFVQGGNMAINNNINIINHGTGFFMAIVSGNINISPSVTSPAGPALEGIYEADGVIDTGNGSSVLPIRGTLVGWGGVTFGRSLANNTIPAETIQYDPILTLLFPRALIQDSVSWQEVIP